MVNIITPENHPDILCTVKTWYEAKSLELLTEEKSKEDFSRIP